MKIMQRIKVLKVALCIAMIALMAGCDRAEQTAESDDDQASGQSAGDQQPLSHVVEFDDFTLRANVSRTDLLPDTMARKYGIEPEPDHFMLNLVIMENRPDRQPVAVSGKVSAEHESLTGHGEVIDMRAVEADGHVSYIGTLDASSQRIFQLAIDVQPEGSDQPLHMNFEVQLQAFESGEFE